MTRYLRAWQKWVKTEQEDQQLREEHNKKTQKMAALLEAAATGRLWSERGGKVEISLELQDIEDDANEQTTSTARKVVSVYMQMKLIFVWKDEYQDSLWKRGQR